KSILTQQELGLLRGTWVTKVQEYDLDIKPTKLVRGRGLCELMTEIKASVPEADQDGIDEDLPAVLFIDLVEEWYSNIAYFLT
ncbi:hypothetical protein KI387_042229, partial [Taxus chinensis]